MVKVQACRPEVSKFENLSCYNVHFRTNTIEENYEPFDLHFSYALNCITVVLL